MRVNANGDTTYFGDFVDAETDDPGDTLQAFLTFDSLATEVAEDLGITEDQRNVLFTHNCLYREQHIYDWYAERNYTEQPFMTERSQAFVDANPSITIDEPMNVNPEFVRQLPDTVYDNYKEWIEYCRLAEAFKPAGGYPDRYWYTDGNPDLPFGWPIRPSDGPDALLDLSYSTSSPLYATASTDGFPLGDLNWFPDKKQEWITGVENRVSHTPKKFQMLQNYPNPFNPTTTISYTLAKPAEVTLTISNLLGQQVRVLVNKKQVSGNYKVVWDGKDDLGKDVTSGVYFYSLKYGKEVTTRKMALVR